MADFVFSSITAAQALAITSADRLLIDVGIGAETTVQFGVPAADQITITSSSGRSVAFGAGATQAAISFADGGRLFIGGTGGDSLAGTASSDGLYGGQGADTLAGGAGSNLLQGNQGDDALQGGANADIIYGGQDNDRITTGAGRNFAQGNRGDDTISGSAADADTLLGGQGNDLIGATGTGPVGDFGLLLDAVGRSGGGGDFLNGNLGNDTIFGGDGADTLQGEDGDDNLNGFGGADVIDGGAGNDVITYAGSATINAGTGDDVVALLNPTGSEPPRNVVVQLGEGDDLMGPLQDTFTTDRFTVDGGAGNDNISTSDGSDSIMGGAGNDTIDGFESADTVSGGAGSDQFAFFAGEAGVVLAQLDVITDWSAEDRLYFAGGPEDAPVGAGTAGNYMETSAADYAAARTLADGQIAGGSVNYVAVQVGADVFVFADSGLDNAAADSAVRLVGRSLADISSSNFTDVTA